MNRRPTLYIRNVPRHVYELLKARAERHGRSVSAEALAIITKVVLPDHGGSGAAGSTAD